MALDPRKRAEFVNAYTRALITAWSSDAYAARLSTDARGALAEAGLQIPADAEIVIQRSVPSGQHEGNLEVQVELWEAKHWRFSPSRYEFHIPRDAADRHGGASSKVTCPTSPPHGTSCCHASVQLLPLIKRTALTRPHRS